MLVLCGRPDCIVVSTSVCGTESSGSNPDQDLLFGVDPSMSKRLFYFIVLSLRSEHGSTLCCS